MNEIHNGKLSSNARKLRKNLTKEERHLWYDFLKGLPVMVHRQKVFGSYIVDFYIAEEKLVIELDGSQHYDPEGRQSDGIRDAYLSSLGLTVLRYSNADVNLRFESVCQDIWNRLKVSEKKPSPRGEGAPVRKLGRMWWSAKQNFHIQRRFAATPHQSQIGSEVPICASFSSRRSLWFVYSANMA